MPSLWTAPKIREKKKKYIFVSGYVVKRIHNYFIFSFKHHCTYIEGLVKCALLGHKRIKLLGSIAVFESPEGQIPALLATPSILNTLSMRENQKYHETIPH